MCARRGSVACHNPWGGKGIETHFVDSSGDETDFSVAKCLG